MLQIARISFPSVASGSVTVTSAVSSLSETATEMLAFSTSPTVCASEDAAVESVVLSSPADATSPAWPDDATLLSDVSAPAVPLPVCAPVPATLAPAACEFDPAVSFPTACELVPAALSPAASAPVPAPLSSAAAPLACAVCPADESDEAAPTTVSADESGSVCAIAATGDAVTSIAALRRAANHFFFISIPPCISITIRRSFSVTHASTVSIPYATCP